MEEYKYILIDGSNYQNRLDHLLAHVPGIFKYKTLLYIGANNRLQLFDEFVVRGYEIDVVEAYPPNVIKLADVEGIRTIYNTDIVRFNNSERYDVVLFWHGIEHLNYYQVPKLLKKLKKICNKFIVFGMPFGEYPQGAEYGNPYEVHKTKWYPNDILALGMNVSTIGRKDTKRANMIAWLESKSGRWV